MHNPSSKVFPSHPAVSFADHPEWLSQLERFSERPFKNTPISGQADFFIMSKKFISYAVIQESGEDMNGK